MNTSSLHNLNPSPMHLHEKLTSLVKTERRIMHEVLRCIYLIDKTKAYADLGYSSLFDYLVRAQGYSETSALNRIDGVRLLKEVPEIATKLQEGSLNLSQLHKVKVAINQDQKTTGIKVSAIKKLEILQKIENCTLQKTEMILANELQYQPRAKEKVLEKSNDVYLTVKLTKAQYEKLQKAQSLLSHINIHNNYANLLEVMSEFVITKKLGSKKTSKESGGVKEESNGAENNRSNNNETIINKVKINETKTSEIEITSNIINTQNLSKNSAQESRNKVPPKPHREFIPLSTRKLIYQNAKHSCEFVSPLTGKRCGSNYQLQMDHRSPIAKGGSSQITNLRLLCRTHNLSEARRWGLNFRKDSPPKV